MAEPFKRPTELDKKKVLDLIDDNIIFNLVYGIVDGLNSPRLRGINLIESEYNKWKALTRLMIINKGAVTIYSDIDNTIEEISNNSWKDFKIPCEEQFEGWKPSRLNEKIKILDVAKKFNIKVKGNKCICPFHQDNDASLIFYPKTNSFFCFGCRTGGDVVSFYKKLKELGK